MHIANDYMVRPPRIVSAVRIASNHSRRLSMISLLLVGSPLFSLSGALLFAGTVSRVLAQETPEPRAAPEMEVLAALSPVGRLVHARRDREALQLLAAMRPPIRDAPFARYLEGRVRERNREFELASAAYRQVGESDLVHDDAMARLSRLWVRSGRCDEASALLAARHDAEAHALKAQCALVAGEASRELFVDLPEGSSELDPFALRFMAAEYFARNGERERGAHLLRGLVVEYPEHPDIEMIESAWRALDERALSVDERLARARRLDRVRLHARAASELDSMPERLTRVQRAAWLHTLGMALYRSRSAYERAAEVLARAARLPSATALEDAFHSARALSRAGRNLEAIAAYRRLVRNRRDAALSAQAYYLSCWLALRPPGEETSSSVARRRARAAEREMDRFVRSAAARLVPEFAREGRWLVALAMFRRGAFADAAGAFERYAQSGRSAMTRGRGLYWMARALAAEGESSRAAAVWRRVVASFPLHWYGLLSKQRLLQAGESVSLPYAIHPSNGDQDVELELPREVAILHTLGLSRDAQSRLRASERRYRGQLRALLEAYRMLGDYQRAYRLSASLDALERFPPENQWAWDAAYPRAFESDTTAAAEREGLIPELLWAIMRQESSFNAEVVSYADAIGLMQLLPETADRVARQNEIDVGREQLFLPSVNIRVGAMYVRGLFRRLAPAGEVDLRFAPLVFGGFNAGGHRIEEWRARSGSVELDLFVEDIPFEQTRNYVRRVTSHLARYLYMRDPSRWPDLDLLLRLEAN